MKTLSRAKPEAGLNLIGGDVVNALGASGDVGEDRQRHLLHLRTTFQPEKREQQPEVTDALDVGAWKNDNDVIVAV